MENKINELIKFCHDEHKNASDNYRKFKESREIINKASEYGKQVAYASVIDRLEAIRAYLIKGKNSDLDTIGKEIAEMSDADFAKRCVEIVEKFY